MTHAPSGPLGEAGARLRALVAQMSKYADEIHYRDAARIREWVTELDALLSAAVVSLDRRSFLTGWREGYEARGTKVPSIDNAIQDYDRCAAPVVTQEGE